MEYNSLLRLLLQEDAASIARGLSTAYGDAIADENVRCDGNREISRVADRLSEVSTLLREDQSKQPSNNIVTRGVESSPRSLLQSYADDEMPAVTIPLEGIRQVAQSKFLTAKELGRFLFLSHPWITKQLGYHFIWGCLCSSLVPTLSCHPSLSGYSHEWIYRQFSKPVPMPVHGWPPIARPSLQPESMVLFLQWFACKTHPTPVATIQIPSPNLEELLDSGQTVFPLSLQDHHHPHQPNDLSFSTKALDHLHVRILCVRHDRRQCCCLHDTGELTWYLHPSHDSMAVESLVTPFIDLYIPQIQGGHGTLGGGASTDHDDDRDDDGWPINVATGMLAGAEEGNCIVETGSLFFGPKDRLALDGSGKDLETRLARGDREVGGFELVVVADASRRLRRRGGIGGRRRNTDATSLSSRDDDPWQVKELKLQFWAAYNETVYLYNSHDEVPKHGVTMLHILDELLGWKD